MPSAVLPAYLSSLPITVIPEGFEAISHGFQIKARSPGFADQVRDRVESCIGKGP